MSEMKLSSQGRASIVMVFTKGLIEMADMSEVLTGLRFAENEDGELVCLNPPVVNMSNFKEAREGDAQNLFKPADSDSGQESLFDLTGEFE